MKYQGEAVSMPAANGGFTVVVFNGQDVPVGTKVYTVDEKDAKLFAAAPDLLEALRCAKQALQEWQAVAPEYITEIDEKANKMINNAIAKALGE